MLSAKIPNATRKAVYRRDGYACAICRRDDVIHIHHNVPRSRGGGNDERNLITLCPVCHAVAHGEYEFKYDFPFDRETIEDAIHYYLEYMHEDEPP